MPNRRCTYRNKELAVTCPNFAVTAMYEDQFTEPFLIDLRLNPNQIKADT